VRKSTRAEPYSDVMGTLSVFFKIVLLSVPLFSNLFRVFTIIHLETSRVSMVYSVAAVLFLQFVLHAMLLLLSNFSLLSFGWEIFTYPGM